jgi:hypothetical protein
MARSFLIFILFLIYPSVFLFSQVPSPGIFFQAIARDNYANPAKDRKIHVQAAIIQTTTTGTKALIEEFQTSTDATGIFSISIGQGIRKGGTANNLSDINWDKGPYFLNLKISISPTAPIIGWDYNKDWIDLGVTPFGTVPYALYAESVAGMDQKINSSDTAKLLAAYAKSINTITPTIFNSGLLVKLNLADSITSYVTPTQLASKTFDLTPVNLAIASKLNLSDSNTLYITPSKFTNGLVGPQGLQGIQGTIGLQGPIGLTGAQGLRGEIGIPGINGTNGINGSDGAIGQQGIQGIIGLQGPIGLTGAQGLRGEIGQQGIQGIQGQIGFPGMSGTNGIDGINNVIADLSAATGILPTSNGGTGLSLLGAPGNQLKVNAAGTGFDFFMPSANANTGSFSFIDNNIKATSDDESNINPVIIGNDAVKFKIDSWADNLNNVLIGNAIDGSTVTLYSTNNSTNIYTGGSYLGWYDNATPNDIYTEVSSTSSGAFVITNDGFSSYSWNFNNSGNLLLPDNGTIIFSDGNRSILLSDILPIPVDDGSYENYVLTADAEGNASWQPSASSKAFSVVFTENINPDADPFAFYDDDIAASVGLDIREANNINFGNNSFVNNFDGIGNISIGDKSLELNTSGSANTGVGFKVFAKNTTGSNNNAVGAFALYNNTEGNFNVAFGNKSMLANTIGYDNSAFGFETLASNIDGSSNSAFGIYALKFNTIGYANSAFGRRALEQNFQGEENASFGAWSLRYNTTGSYNTAFGTNALEYNISGNYNTAVGYEANVYEDNLENATAIGAGAVVNESNTIQLGADGISNDYYSAVTSVRTSGKLTTGVVTYPNEDGSAGQVLATDGSGALYWSDLIGTQGIQGIQGLQGVQGLPGNSSNVFSSITVNNVGGTPGIFLNQTNPNSATWLRVGTEGNGAEYGVAGGSNQFFDGTVLGDIALKAFSGNHLTKMFIGAAFDGQANLVLSPDRTTEVIGKLTAPELTVGSSTSTISAALDINSTSKGFLPPRLTTSQKNTIVSPVAGLVLWCSDCGVLGALQVYNGTSWINL